MNLTTRIEQMGKQLLALVLVTVALSLGDVITSLGDAADGETFGYTRIALGLSGVAGAALVVLGRDYGKPGLMSIMAWAAIQSVFYAKVPDGNYTGQLVDALAGAASQSTVNGTITEYSAIGLNISGLVMLGFAYMGREQITLWVNRATRGFSG